jgi:hypothetical protein
VAVVAPVEEVPVEEVPVEDVPVELPVEPPVEAAFALVAVVPLDEPPHAVNPIQASNRINSAATACPLRPLVLVWGMELLCR